ncbi:MAG: cysteine desulfurase family protein [Bacillota bacterium]
MSTNSAPVYMDNSATTRPFPEVIEAMTDVYREQFGNPSSLHWMGYEAEKLVSKARRSVASLLGTGEDQVYFTSGGTEANNWAIFGSLRSAGERYKHVVTSAVEHPSILATMEYLEQLGYRVSVAPVDRYGRVNPEEVLSLVAEDTCLVSVMYVQNEIGAVQPCAEIGAGLSEMGPRRPRFHVDAVQGFARLEIDVSKWGIDLISISSHKIHGPKGMGALYIRKGVPMHPLIFGGGQEQGLRSGTENVPAIVGFGVACDIWAQIAHQVRDNLYNLRKRLISGIAGVFPDAVLNGPPLENVAPHIVNFSFPGFRGETLLNALEQRNVFVSTGSACSSRKSKPSPVVLALGKSEAEALSAIRFSMSPFTTAEEVDITVSALEDALKELGPWRRKLT